MERRRTALLTVGVSFIALALLVVQGALLARLLGPVGRGEYGTIIFFTNIVSSLCMLGVLPVLTRRAALEPQNAPGLLRSATRAGFVLGIAGMLVVALCLPFGLPADKKYLAPLAILFSLTLPFQQIMLARMAVDQGRAAFNAYNMARSLYIALFVLGLACCMVFHNHSLTLITFVMVPVFLLSVLIQIISWQKDKSRNRAIETHYEPSIMALVREGVPYAVTSMVTSLLSKLDLFLSIWLMSLQTQGFYNVALPMASVLIVVPNVGALYAFNAAAIASRHGKPKSKFARSIGLLFLFQIVSALLLAVALPYLAPVVFGARFAAAVPFAWALLPAYAINGVITYMEGHLQGGGKPMFGVVGRVGSCIVMVIGSVTLRHVAGDFAIPFSVCLGALVNGVIILFIMQRQAFSETEVLCD
jgi:O-antigen/teichoic acid export membrane protein